ncbi:MAG: type VI secretion system contractile sheath small subunit [Gammaproteobacteria bacterium]|nr:type VI secretion system contractile sheath small subunit [Gammaproteobacteria bacterium]
MAGDSSVAPKERINISYKSGADGAQQDVELPFKMLYVGDFTGRQDDRPLEDRKPIDINKENFNDVLKNMSLSVNLSVPNKVSGVEGDELSASIKFESMNDFGPESVAHQIPETAKLLELRQALVALKGPLGNVPAFRRKLQDMIGDENARAKLMSELKIEGK